MSDDAALLQTIQKELASVITKLDIFSGQLESLDRKLDDKFMSKEAARRLEDKIAVNEARVSKLEAANTWLIRSILGALITAGVAAIVYLIKT